MKKLLILGKTINKNDNKIFLIQNEKTSKLNFLIEEKGNYCNHKFVNALALINHLEKKNDDELICPICENHKKFSKLPDSIKKIQNKKISTRIDEFDKNLEKYEILLNTDNILNSYKNGK